MKKALAIGLALCIMISLAVIPVSVHAVAKGDYYTIKGTATDVNVLDIVVIGPNGCKDIPLSVENGFYYTTATVAEDNTFEKDIYIPEEADTGRYTAAILTAGRDGTYEATTHGEGELIEALLEEHGIEEEGFVGKSTSQLLAMIQEATVDKVGSDDMMTVSTFSVDSPYIDFDNIEVVGDQVIVTGKTNRAPETSITISLTGPAELPSVTTEVEWPTPDYGVFEATFDITDAVAGAYTIKADDGEGNTVEATIVIGAPVPTPTSPTPPPTSTPPTTPTPTSAPAGEPELSISQTTLKEEPEVGEEVLITVAILNKGKVAAKNIHLEENIPSSIVVSYVEGAEKAGGLVYWNGELEPGESHSITHMLRILEEKSRTIPVTVTYEDASGNEKQKSTEIYLTAKREKEVTPPPSPLSNIPWLYIIILVAVVLGGIAIIVAVRRRGGEGGAEVTIEENK